MHVCLSPNPQHKLAGRQIQPLPRRDNIISDAGATALSKFLAGCKALLVLNLGCAPWAVRGERRSWSVGRIVIGSVGCKRVGWGVA